MSIVRFQDLPVAESNRRWSRTGADKRVRKWASAEEGPNDKYRKAFVWYDSDQKDNFGGHKFQIADVVDGKLTVVARAITSAAGVVQGARGGTDLPQSEIRKVKSHLARYYKKMGERPPWDK